MRVVAQAARLRNRVQVRQRPVTALAVDDVVPALRVVSHPTDLECVNYLKIYQSIIIINHVLHQVKS